MKITTDVEIITPQTRGDMKIKTHATRCGQTITIDYELNFGRRYACDRIKNHRGMCHTTLPYERNDVLESAHLYFEGFDS